MPPCIPLSIDRAQSETVGVVLLTGVVVIAVAVIGGVVLSDVGSDAGSPVVDIRGNVTSQHVTVTHSGGDSLPASDVDIVVEGDRRVRHSLDSYTQRIGSDDTRFERGDSWRRSNDVAGDRLTLIAVHVPSNTILDRETVTVRVTSFARFSYEPQNPTPTSTVDFDASDSEFTGATVDTYEWDFDDDGNTDATGETASYSFPDDGEYPVTLTITADDGRTANRTKTVTVYNRSPEASFTSNRTNPDPGDTIEFDASASSDPDGTIDSYEWDFDGDGVTDKTGEIVDYTYASTGEKTVRLTVTDDDGASRTESQTVTVLGSQPRITARVDDLTAQDTDQPHFIASYNISNTNASFERVEVSFSNQNDGTADDSQQRQTERGGFQYNNGYGAGDTYDVTFDVVYRIDGTDEVVASETVTDTADARNPSGNEDVSEGTSAQLTSWTITDNSNTQSDKLKYSFSYQIDGGSFSEVQYGILSLPGTGPSSQDTDTSRSLNNANINEKYGTNSDYRLFIVVRDANGAVVDTVSITDTADGDGSFTGP